MMKCSFPLRVANLPLSVLQKLYWDSMDEKRESDPTMIQEVKFNRVIESQSFISVVCNPM